MVALALAAAPAPALAAWFAPETLSDPGQDSWPARVAMGDGGAAVAVWSRSDGTAIRAQAAVRPAGRAFQPALTLSEPGANAYGTEVAMTRTGEAIVVWSRHDGTAARVQAAILPAAGGVGAPVTLSAAGSDATDPEIAVDADGDAVAVWSRFDGANQRIQASLRPAGGSFGPPQTLSAAGQPAFFPRVAVAPGGNALAVWQRFDGSNQRIQASFRPAGASFGGVQTISAAGQDATKPDVAIDSSGRAVAVWQRFDGAHQRVQAAARGTAGDFAAPQMLSAAGQDAVDPDVAVGAGGASVAAWERSEGSVQRVQVASRPAAGDFGAAQTLSAAGAQALDPTAGVGADGAAIVVWHQLDGGRFAIRASRRPAGGSFGATARISDPDAGALSPDLAVDADGDALAGWHRFANHVFETQTADWAVDDRPPPRRQGSQVPVLDLTAPPNVALADTIAPVVTRFTVTRRFMAGRRGTRLRAALRRGGRIRYRLSEPASVAITISPLQRGRMTRACRRARRCARLVRKRVVLHRRGRAGANASAFSGRIGRRALAPGRWRATIRAKDPAGNRSRPQRATFTIVTGATR